jgi:hypothetical protein
LIPAWQLVVKDAKLIAWNNPITFFQKLKKEQRNIYMWIFSGEIAGMGLALAHGH